MAKPLIDKRYYPLIWIALVFASLVANVYVIYLSFQELEAVTVSRVLLNVFRAIFANGAIPAAWCFILALIAYSAGARRYYGVVPRSDFIYTVMAFTAGARVLMGIVDVFCILEPRMGVFTSSFLDLVVLTVAYAIMFFLVIDKRYKMNPIERFGAFSNWAGIYLILMGLSVVVLNAVYLIVFSDDTLLKRVNEALAEIAGYTLVKDSLQTVASAIALSLYAAIVIATVVIGEILKKRAKNYQAPETRGDYFDQNPNNPYTVRSDAGDVYGFDQNPSGTNNQSDGDSDKKDDNNSDGHVFDEFDI